MRFLIDELCGLDSLLSCQYFSSHLCQQWEEKKYSTWNNETLAESASSN